MDITELVKVGNDLPPGGCEWKLRLEKTVDGITLNSETPNIAGEFLAFNFSGARLYYLHSQAQNIARARACRNRFAPMVVVPVSGSLRVSQLGRNCVVAPGQFVFIDSAAPLELDYETAFENIFLHLPSSSFVPALFHRAISKPVDANCDFDFLFKSLIESTWSHATKLRPDEHGAVLNSILSLCPLTSPFRAQFSQEEPCIRVTKAMAFIEDNLGESWLNPQVVADHQGVSRRYLDDRFGRLGLRIERWIWERRLLRAREELGIASRGGRFMDKTIIQIALDNGFKSPSHFSRSFSERFGVSPREYRKSICESSNGLH